jgi:hypothetical protein
MTDEIKEAGLIKNVTELIEKVDTMKKQDKLDLSSDQDLSIAIMNLVSIEEHFFFTGAKLNKPEYFDLLQEARRMRGELLRKIVKDPEGEVWCISKHLLAASMRLMEVGTKQQGMGRKEDAKELFQKAYDLYSLFWGINMKVISTDNIKHIDSEALNRHDQSTTDTTSAVSAEATAPISSAAAAPQNNVTRSGFMGKLGELVRKAIDCCIE